MLQPGKATVFKHLLGKNEILAREPYSPKLAVSYLSRLRGFGVQKPAMPQITAWWRKRHREYEAFDKRSGQVGGQGIWSDRSACSVWAHDFLKPSSQNVSAISNHALNRQHRKECIPHII